MQPLFIDIPSPQRYYSLFYMVAFFVSFIILIAEGRRRRLPQLPWLIVIGTGYIFFVFGCRMVTFSLEDWKTILHNQPLEHATGLVMLGGLLFCVPAILIAKRFCNLNTNVLDAYAFVLPVGMCLQRIGCFLNGCCFGTITGTGWGIQYGQETSAFQHHYMEGLIPQTATTSLSIHPVQLYESLGCLIAVVLLLNVKSKFKSHGSLFYLSGLTYYTIRFTTEFFRAEAANANEVSSWFQLNTIQWIMMVLILGSCLIIFLKEKKPTLILKRPEPSSFSLRYVIYFLIISVIFCFASKWLSLTEILVVYMALFSTGGYILVELFKSVTVPRFRFAFSILILVSFIMMSQTYPEQAASDSTKISYNTISIGGLLGSQNLSVAPISSTDCDGNSTYIPGKEYENKYKIAAIGFSRTIQTAEAKSFTFGLNAYTGVHDEYVTGGLTSDRPELHTYGFNPFIQSDSRLFGFGAGFHMGDMSYIPSDQEVTSIKRYSFYPQVYMRIGHLKYVFGEINLARNFPSSFPGTFFQTSLGFGVNRKNVNSGVFRIGTSSSTGIFLSSTIPIGNNFVMEPYFGFAGSLFIKTLDYSYDSNNGLVGSLSLHYKFDKKIRQ